MKFEKQVRAALNTSFFAVKPRIILKIMELFPATKKMYYVLNNKATLFTIFHAAAIVGMWVIRPKVARQNPPTCS